MKKLLAFLSLTLLATGCFSEKNNNNESASINEKPIVRTTSQYSSMYVRGTNTNWSGGTEMALSSDNTWTATVRFSSLTNQSFKFSTSTTSWQYNWGDNNCDGYANSNEGNIPVTGGKTYNITFNDSTKAYSCVENTSQRDIKIYGTFNGIGGGNYYSALKVKLYKASNMSLVAVNNFTSSECCAQFLSLEPSTSYIALVDQISYDYFYQKDVQFSGYVSFTTTSTNTYQSSKTINFVY